MVKTLSILLCLCCCISISAQFHFGIKASTGTVFSSHDIKQFVSCHPIQIFEVGVGKSAHRHSLGLTVQHGNEKLFVMADGLMTTQSQNYELIAEGLYESRLDPARQFNTKTTNLRLVITAGAKLKDFRIGVGPELAIVMSETENLTQLSKFENDSSKLQGGFNFLVGYRLFNDLELNLKYLYYYESVGSNFSFNGIPLDFDSNPTMLEASMAYYF